MPSGRPNRPNQPAKATRKPAQQPARPVQSSAKPRRSPVLKIILILIILALIAGVIVIFVLASRHPEILGGPSTPTDFPEPIYSQMTGLDISSETLNQSPTYCVQIPNGSTDGARPQAGLNAAAVVFEAVAEQGITRFAAIFQNPDVSVIGPVRSLRPYYLDWDTPFDCTIVHAGGSEEALTAVGNGQYRNLDIDTGYYSWREVNTFRLWNNLFTSPSELANYNQSKGYHTSAPKTFPRLSPEELENLQSANAACAENPDCQLATATHIEMSFWNIAAYSPVYDYDAESNTYRRSYADGEPHVSYECPANLTQPNTKADCGEPVQLAPSAVAVMMVRENTMSDQYHENIKTIGSGVAYVFQNGTVIEGQWQKSSQSSQIVFTDQTGATISFTPGQLWIAAVPQYGDISWR